MRQLATQREIPLNLFTVANPLSGTVLENHRLTPPDGPPANDIRHLVLDSPGLAYLPGQSVGVIPDGDDPRTGRPHKLRLYSVSSESKGDHGDWNTVSVVVVRHFWHDQTVQEISTPGVCSKYLCDLQPGENVQITGPVGKRFLLPPDFHRRDLIFVATGTGIAPYRGMLQEMFDQDYQSQVLLVFGVQHSGTLLYDDEFRSYLDRPNFRYATALSRESEQNPFPDELPTHDNKLYVQVRLWQRRHEIARSLEKPDTLVYVCGRKGMEKGVFCVINLIGERLGRPDLAARMRSEQRLLEEVY